MILIITTEAGDFSHLKIIDWLDYYGASYKIITGEGILTGEIEILIKDGCIICDDINLTDSVSCVYYRRWFLSSEIQLTDDSILNSTLSENLYFENQEIKKYIFNNLMNALWIPNPFKINVNKLTVLEEAQSIGLNVPQYIVTNKKQELDFFFNAYNKDIICKAIGNYSGVTTKDNFRVNPIYTKRVSEVLIKSLPNHFSTSFFQRRVDKILELRIFYFNNKTYSTGILSQDNELTKYDSRENSELIESRLVPVTIDASLESKIVLLMNRLGLNIGSIDIILGSDKKYYFLEVNPVGQIAGYSQRSGFNIEKEIVDYLIETDLYYGKRNTNEN